MRRILCFVLTLIACLMLATIVSAEEATVPTYCQACGKDVTDWKVAPSNWRTLEEGHHHFYLSESKSGGYYWRTPNTNNTASSEDSAAPVTICLDLNGFNNTRDGRAMSIYKGATVNIMDSSEAQTGYVKSTSGSNATVGGTVYLAGTLNLYNGALKYANDGTGSNQAYAGGVIAVYSGGNFHMYDGRLEGGEMVSNANAKAGTMYITGTGTVTVSGGEIISGTVPAGKPGPCAYLDSTAQLTLSGDAKVDDIYLSNNDVKLNISGTYSGKARVTLKNTPSAGKVIGSATGTPKLTGDLFCTNGDGWVVNLDGSSLKLATYTPSGEWHYCQHCKEVRRWTAMTSSNYKTPKTVPGDYHYYLATDFSDSGSNYLQLCSGAQVCLDLYGNSVTNTKGRALLPNGGATLNLMDTVGGGYAAGSTGTNNPRGGTITVSGKATLNMYSGTLKFNYTEGAEGGTYNGIVAIGGTLNMYGGRIEGAPMIEHKSGIGGAAIHMYNTTSALNLYGGEIVSGSVPAKDKGPCIYVPDGPTVKLSGDATVENIYFVTNSKKLTVSGEYTGIASLTYSTVPELGDEVGVSENAEITGRITCTNGDRLITVQDDALILSIDAPVAIVTESGETGYETLQAAMDAYETGCIKLYKPLTEDVTVSKDAVIDLNGNTVIGTVTVAAGKTLYGTDSQTDDYTVADGAYGKLTVSGTVAAQDGYLMVTESGAVSFHKYTVEIHTMTLRSEKAGLYYKSTFLGDEKVAAAVQSFGVALSVYETPTASNMDTACKYSAFTTFESGATGNATTSTLLSGILKEKNSTAINQRNMNMQIYGRPYIKTADGYIFGEVKSRNLTEQLQGVDAQLDTLTDVQRTGLLTMYQTYQEALRTVDLPNIENSNQTLRILMVGNSFCYYYVEELYGLLMANPDTNRGYTDVEIYNLYYSGCSLTMHYEWWVAGAANYDLYKTDKNGRVKQTPATGTVWTLEEALQQGKWNYISLQGASSENNYSGATMETNVAKMIPLVTPLLARFHEAHPQAQLLWHRTWAFEVGRISGSITYDEETLAAYDAGMQAVCDYMCSEFDKDKPYDLKMVNSGAGWAIARAENAKLETSLIPTEGGLCARKGVRNEKTYPYYTGNANAGDGYHDGDIGGGQFLNACAWYETLTGQSVLDNPYRPTTTKGTYEVSGKYELSEAFANLLRNAAHTALNPTEE